VHRPHYKLVQIKQTKFTPREFITPFILVRPWNFATLEVERRVYLFTASLRDGICPPPKFRRLTPKNDVRKFQNIRWSVKMSACPPNYLIEEYFGCFCGSFRPTGVVHLQSHRVWPWKFARIFIRGRRNASMYLWFAKAGLDWLAGILRLGPPKPDPEPAYLSKFFFSC